MDWKISRHADDGYFVVTSGGNYDSGDHQKMVAEILSHADWKPDTNTLFDSRELSFSGSEFADIFAASTTHQANDRQIGTGKIAMVVVRLSDQGVTRQFQLISEDAVSAELKIFEDIDLARVWLASDLEV